MVFYSTDYVANDNFEHVDLHQGDIYEDEEVAKWHMFWYGLDAGICLSQVHANKKKQGAVKVALRFVCNGCQLAIKEHSRTSGAQMPEVDEDGNRTSSKRLCVEKITKSAMFDHAFYVDFIKQKDEQHFLPVKIQFFNDHFSGCSTASVAKIQRFSIQTKVRYLSVLIRCKIKGSFKCTDIAATLNQMYNIHLNGKQVADAIVVQRSVVLKKVQGQFDLLKSYTKTLKDQSCGTSCELRQQQNVFTSIFIAPSAAKTAAHHLIPVVHFGEHELGMNCGNSILLFACARDRSNRMVLLCWSVSAHVVDEESPWKQFIRSFAKAYEDVISHGSIVLMVDSLQALTEIKSHFDQSNPYKGSVFPSFCTDKLRELVITKLGKKEVKPIDRLLNAIWKHKFDKYFAGITNVALKDLLLEVPPELWSDLHFQVPRFGSSSNKNCELLKKAILPLVGYCVLDLLKGLWDYQQQTFCSRHDAICAQQDCVECEGQLVPMDIQSFIGDMHLVLESIIRSINEIANRGENQVRFEVVSESSPYSKKGLSKVDLDLEDIDSHIVIRGSCSCSRFQDTLLPCVHALAARRELENTNSKSLLFDLKFYWYDDSYRTTYQNMYEDINLNDLSPSKLCAPFDRQSPMSKLKYEETSF